MKNTILSLLLLLLSSVAFAGNWVPIEEGPNGDKLHFEAGSVVKNGSGGMIRIMVNLSVPMPTSNGQARSFVSIYMFNCFAPVLKVTEMTLYDQPNGVGRAMDNPWGESGNISFIPGSVYAIMQDSICR